MQQIICGISYFADWFNHSPPDMLSQIENDICGFNKQMELSIMLLMIPGLLYLIEIFYLHLSYMLFYATKDTKQQKHHFDIYFCYFYIKRKCYSYHKIIESAAGDNFITKTNPHLVNFLTKSTKIIPHTLKCLF